MKRTIPLIITSVTALVLILSQATMLGRKLEIPKILDRYYLLAQAGAFMLGSIGLTRLHLQNIIRRREGYAYSIVLLVALWGFFILGLFQTSNGRVYQWVFNATLPHLESTTFAVIAFYIASAAYRAFRMRNIDSSILLITGALVILGSVPIGEAMWKALPSIKTWIMNVPNSAVQRGLQICIRVGSFAVALRVLMALERAHVGRGSD